jgi:SHS family lactate transporter-like MFS transporter
MIANLVAVACLSLGTAFCQTFQSFLAVRALFGIAMGGVWSQAVATALENMPIRVRGLASGFLQQGYAIGYLIMAVVNLYLVPQTNQWVRYSFEICPSLKLTRRSIYSNHCSTSLQECHSSPPSSDWLYLNLK